MKNLVLRSRHTGRVFKCTPGYKFAQCWDETDKIWYKHPATVATLKSMKHIGQNYKLVRIK